MVKNTINTLNMKKSVSQYVLLMLSCAAVLSGCEKPASTATSYPVSTASAPSHQEIKSQKFHIEIVDVASSLPTCQGNLCPQIAIQHIRSDAPNLDKAVDLYIQKYVNNITEGFTLPEEQDHNSNDTTDSKATHTAPIAQLNHRRLQSSSPSHQSNDEESSQNLDLQHNINKIFALAKEGQQLGLASAFQLVIEAEIIKDQPRHMITVILHSRNYMGGAHGSESEQYFHYRLDKKSLIHLDDIIVTGQRKAFNDLAFSAFQQWVKETQMEISLEEYQATWPFMVSENFYFSEQGLVLKYDEYQIAPYVAGLPSLLIPYQKLENIIKKDYLLAQIAPAATVDNKVSHANITTAKNHTKSAT